MRDGDAVVGTAEREFGAGARSGVLQTGSVVRNRALLLPTMARTQMTRQNGGG